MSAYILQCYWNPILHHIFLGSFWILLISNTLKAQPWRFKRVQLVFSVLSQKTKQLVGKLQVPKYSKYKQLWGLKPDAFSSEVNLRNLIFFYKLFNYNLNYFFSASWFTIIIITHRDRMWEYMPFGLYIPEFCRSKVSVYISYNSGTWTKCSMSMLLQ